MSIIVGDLILEVSTLLNDQGFTPYLRWSQTELLRYLNDSLIQVGTYRPDAFTTTVVVTLVPGSMQTLPAGFSFLKSVDTNSANSNCPSAPVVEGDLNLMRAFYKKPCLPTGGANNYRVRQFLYDSRNPNLFYVSPPVPVGVVTLQVDLTAVSQAPEYTIADLANPIVMDQKYRNALISWMVMRAYEVDTESATSFAQAREQRSHFYQMLGINYKQESLYKSGYYLGERGMKDPAPSRH